MARVKVTKQGVNNSLVFTQSNGSDGSITFNGSTFSVNKPIAVDTVYERTSGSGVTIDGVLLKDGTITTTAPTIKSVAPAITATGTDDTDGYALTEELNIITGGAANTGVELPTAVVGLSITVVNLTGTAKKVYATTGDAIDDKTATTGYVIIQPEDTVTFNCYTVALWQSDFEADGVYDTLYVDTVAENTSAAGVTIDGVVLKDGSVRTTSPPTGLNASAFSIGTYATPVVDANASDAFALTINMSTGVNKTSAGDSCMGAYVRMSNTANGVNTRLQGVLASTAVAFDCFDAYGLQSNMTISAGAVATGNLTAVSGKVTVSDAVATGVISAGLFTLDGAFNPTASTYGVWIDITNGITADAGLIINNNASTVVTAISVAGGATTGLLFTGTYTNVIDLTSATLTEGSDNALFSIGSYGTSGSSANAKSVALTTSAFYTPFQINLNSSANPTVETIMQAQYIKAQTTGDQANMNLIASAVRATVGGNVAQAYGIQCHLNVSAAAVVGTNANCCAGSFKTTITGAVNLNATTNVMLLTFENASGSVTGEKNMMTLDPVAAVNNVFQVYNIANTTYLFEFGAATGCAAGTSKNGASTGSIAINIGGTPRYIPFY
jgi:hypothetical protein